MSTYSAYSEIRGHHPVHNYSTGEVYNTPLRDAITAKILSIPEVKTLTEIRDAWIASVEGLGWKDVFSREFPEDIISDIFTAKSASNPVLVKNSARLMFDTLTKLPGLSAPKRKGVLII